MATVLEVRVSVLSWNLCGASGARAFRLHLLQDHAVSARPVCWLIDSFGAEFLCVPGFNAGLRLFVAGLLTPVEAQCMLCWSVFATRCMLWGARCVQGELAATNGTSCGCSHLQQPMAHAIFKSWKLRNL
jgi:hypothetical protein